MSDRSTAARMLQKQFRDLQAHPCEYFSCGFIDDDVFRWRVTIIGPQGTPYQGGFFPTEIDFPDSYPQQPPTMKFLCPMWHPNIGKDGKVCISILHQPGKDEFGYESAGERWLPIHTVETIVISVISMLNDPNPESPLNVEANRDFLTNKDEFKKKVKRCTARSVDYC